MMIRGMTGIAMSAPTESADYRIRANHRVTRRVTRSMTGRSRPMSSLIWLSPGDWVMMRTVQSDDFSQ